MKKEILFIIFYFCICSIAFADVVVYSDKNTKEVLFIVEGDTVVLSEEDEPNIDITILPNDIEFYALTEQYSDYKLSNKKFILNTQKISDRENEIIDEKDKKIKKDTDFESAKGKLTSGTWIALNDDEVDSLLK